MTFLSPFSSQKLVLDTPALFLSFFETFIQTEVGEGAASSDTLKTYSSNLAQYLHWCEQHQRHPLQVSRSDLKLYRHWLLNTQGYRSRSVALKLSVVRRFYYALVENDYLSANPAIGLKAPREIKDPTATINYLQQEEMSQLIDALPVESSLDALRDRLLVSVMGIEGCRTVEMHRLNMGDVVRERDCLGLRVQGKRSIRVVPLTPALSALLQDYLNVRKINDGALRHDSPLFISLANGSRGNRLSRRSIQRVIDKYLIKIGLKESPQSASQPEEFDSTSASVLPKAAKKNDSSPTRKLSAHSLRHTVGTLSLKAGASLRQVQDLLGHADPRTTVIYAHIAERWQNNPGLLLERFFLDRAVYS